MSHENCGVPSNSPVRPSQPGAPISTALPEWCSLNPGYALTRRISAQGMPDESFAWMIFRWRVTSL